MAVSIAEYLPNEIRNFCAVSTIAVARWPHKNRNGILTADCHHLHVDNIYCSQFVFLTGHIKSVFVGLEANGGESSEFDAK